MKHTTDEAILFQLKCIQEPEGSLVPITAKTDFIPEIKRVFYAYDVPDEEERGFHAHKECHQILICMTGNIVVTVSDGVSEKKVLLDNPSKALYLPAGLWAQELYRNQAILMVICSEVYDPADYIVDIDEYKTWNMS